MQRLTFFLVVFREKYHCAWRHPIFAKKNNVNKSLFLLCCLLAYFQVSGQQQDSVVSLEPVSIVAERISKISRAGNLMETDSVFLSQQAGAMLSELLGARAGIFFKRYSPGSLSTITLRGSGASHTALLWNGFNLQNPMNGVTDFALFPVWLMDRIGLQRGGGSSHSGSGSIGGTIFLNDQLPDSVGLVIRTGAAAGSFENRQQFASLEKRQEKWGSKAKFFHQSATNNFEIPGAKGRSQVNASLAQTALTQHNSWKINQRNALESFIWWQRAGRNIPPSLTEVNTNARQEDHLGRYGLSWTRTGQKSISKARAGYFRDEILFFSQVIDSSRSVSKTLSAELEQAFFLKNGNQTFRTGLQFHHQQASTRETGFRQRLRTVLLAAWEQRWFSGRLISSADLRQELVDGKPIPLVFSAGMERHSSKGGSLYLRFNKSYNLPTFNDLFWQDAQARGNPDLSPESALGGHLGFRLSKKLRGSHFSASTEIFSNHVRDWIQWTLVDKVWTPLNKRGVWARGVETDLIMRTKVATNGAEFIGSLSASVTRSTVRKIYTYEAAALLHQQLIYTPVFTAASYFGIRFKGYSLFANQYYTGLRHTTSDNTRSAALPAFMTTGISAGKTWRHSRHAFDLNMQIFNLFNAAYQPVAARPAPGRHFRVEFRTTFCIN